MIDFFCKIEHLDFARIRARFWQSSLQRLATHSLVFSARQVQSPAGGASRDLAEASRLHENSMREASDAALLNKPFQLNELARRVGAVFDA